MRPKIILLIFLLFVTQSVVAQIMFQRNYGGVADDFGCKVIQTDDGGYLVAAITESYGAGYRDIFLIRTNEFGDTLWTKTIGGLHDDQPNAMKKTSDNNYIIAGSTSSFGAGNSDVYLLKVDQNGDTIWTKTYGGSMDDQAHDVIQTSDGGYLVIGSTTSFTSGSSSVYAIRTDSNGDTLWTKTYEEKYDNMGCSVVQLSDGGFFFCGLTQEFALSGTADCYFIRTNSQGDTLWTKTYGGNNYDGAFYAYDAGNGIIISGTTKSFGAGGNDIFLGLFNYNGDNLWIKTYGGMNSDYGGAFAPTNDNGYIITGYTKSFGGGDQSMYLIKTDNNGDTLWTRTFGQIGGWGGCVQQTSDNGYIISGEISWYGKGIDVYLVKTNSDGISGFHQIIKPNSTFNVFPNPNNGTFTIQLDKAHSNVSIYVYDLIGRIVYSNNGLFDQLNTEIIKLPDVSDGLYYVHLVSENINAFEKIIIKN